MTTRVPTLRLTPTYRELDIQNENNVASQIKIGFYLFVYIITSNIMAGEGENLVEVIENYVMNNKVMVFSKSYCPFCIKVKELFKSLGVDFFAVELDQIDNGSEMQQAMAKKAGRSSVPQVFINGNHVGGCDDTMAAHTSGKLQTILAGH